MEDNKPSATDEAKTAAQTSAPADKPDAQNLPVEGPQGDDDASFWAEMETNETGSAPPDEDQDRVDFEGDADTVPDPFASLPEEIRQQFDSLKAEKEKLENRVKSEVGRNAASQRRIAELQKMVSSPVHEDRDEDPSETLRALAEDYPEVAGPVAEALNLMRGQVGELKTVERNRREAATQELNDLVTAEESAVADAHPGWEGFLKDNGTVFTQWIDDQPRAVRESFIRNANTIVDGHAAIEVISAFKRHLNPQLDPAAPQHQPPNTRRERQLAASASPSTSTRAPVVSGIPETADEQVLWDAMEEQDKREQRR